MQQFIVGNRYNLAVLVSEQTDPTDPTEIPATGLPDVTVYILAAPLGATEDIATVAIATASATENGTATDSDGVVKAKYDASLVIDQALFTPYAGKQVYVYRSHGSEMLQPEIAEIVSVPSRRRIGAVGGP